MRMITLEEHYATPAFLDLQGFQLTNLVLSVHARSTPNGYPKAVLYITSQYRRLQYILSENQSP
jgi:hypothetical protein